MSPCNFLQARTHGACHACDAAGWLLLLAITAIIGMTEPAAMGVQLAADARLNLHEHRLPFRTRDPGFYAARAARRLAGGGKAGAARDVARALALNPSHAPALLLSVQLLAPHAGAVVSFGLGSRITTVAPGEATRGALARFSAAAASAGAPPHVVAGLEALIARVDAAEHVSVEELRAWVQELRVCASPGMSQSLCVAMAAPGWWWWWWCDTFALPFVMCLCVCV